MQKQNRNGITATTFSTDHVETFKRHLRETKLEITNWFLASVDDLYSAVTWNLWERHSEGAWMSFHYRNSYSEVPWKLSDRHLETTWILPKI